MALYTCKKCSGRLGSSLFIDRTNLICRFCQTEECLNDKLNEANSKIDSLTAEVVYLKDFIKHNIGVNTPTIPIPANLTVTPTNDNPSNTNNQDNFQVVHNNICPKPRKIVPITTIQNRFKILSDIDREEKNEEVRLVGDSMILGQLKEFCARAPKSRKRFCIRGGGVDDINAAIEEVTKQAPDNTTYIIYVGTNDVTQTRSEELLEKYRQLLRNYKNKSTNIIVSGILPRMSAGSQFYNQATSINSHIVNLCTEEEISFINLWDNFYYDESLFRDDGVHLNGVGAARFGRLLNSALLDFRTKNKEHKTTNNCTIR